MYNVCLLHVRAEVDVDASDWGCGCVRRGMRPTKRMRDRGVHGDANIFTWLLPSGLATVRTRGRDSPVG